MAYFIELTTALECQKQLVMSSISNLGGRESLEIAVKSLARKLNLSTYMNTPVPLTKASSCSRHLMVIIIAARN